MLANHDYAANNSGLLLVSDIAINSDRPDLGDLARRRPRARDRRHRRGGRPAVCARPRLIPAGTTVADEPDNEGLDIMAHHATTTITPFSDNPDFDFEIRNILGQAVGGAADPGEVLAATAGIRKNDHAGWFYAWQQLGQRTAEAAQACAAAGHRVSAAGAFLRASTYFGVAVNAASSLKDSAELNTDVPRTTRRVGVVRREHPGERPAGRHSVRELLDARLALPSGARGSRPDPGRRERQRRGARRALGLDGCRCAGARLQRAPLRRTRPAVAALRARRALPSGLGARAHACLRLPRRARRRRRGPHRGLRHQPGRVLGRTGHRVRAPLAAAITDPGVVDVSASWTSQLPKSLTKLLDNGQNKKFDKEMGFGMKFSPGPNAPGCSVPARTAPTATPRPSTRSAPTTWPTSPGTSPTPLLITSPEGEQFWPGQAEELASLTQDVSTTVRFTAAEGAGEHCQPLARTLTAQRMFDWLDDRIGSSSTTDR